MAAMSEAPREGEEQSDREARVLKSVLEADIVPDNKIGKVRLSGSVHEGGEGGRG